MVRWPALLDTAVLQPEIIHCAIDLAVVNLPGLEVVLQVSVVVEVRVIRRRAC